MHATKQPKVADEFVLQTVPVILKNVNRRLVVNAHLDHEYWRFEWKK